MASGTVSDNTDFLLTATILEAINETKVFPILKKYDYTVIWNIVLGLLQH